MKFKLDANQLPKQPTDCVVVGIYDDGKLTPAAAKLDDLNQHFIRQLLKKGDFKGELGQTLLLHNIKPCTRVLLVGCGKNHPVTVRDFRKIVFNSFKYLRSLTLKSVTYCITDLAISDCNLDEKLSHAVAAIYESQYRFDQFKSNKNPTSRLNEIILTIPSERNVKSLTKTLKQVIAVNEGVEFTKDLANLPSNICTPTYLADVAKKLAKSHKTINVKILDTKDMQKLGMHAYLAVTKGSQQPPKFICLEYKGEKKNTAPVALIGKGITFDTGGISLKPAESMVGMKYDMCGAATVLGVFKSAALLDLPINLVGLLATAENMPSGTATKPEDIVVSLSGQTIEIMNTDAEGRLVLCDALTYCERFHPDTVIDIATLTGAVVVALGHHATGLLSNYQPLVDDLTLAGKQCHDRVWQLPLWDEYQDQLKSPFADMSNVGGRTAGTITAACFLSRFAKKFHWAHLDVAGTAAMMMGNDRYATGRPVPLLMQYLINRCEK